MISVALAKYLDAIGLVIYEPLETGGDAFPEHLPDEPDEAVMLLSTGGNSTPAAATWGYDEPTLQLMVRGAPNDPTTPQTRAVALYGALQGLRYTLLDEGGDDEVFVIVCSTFQTGPYNIGTDEKGRYRYTLNVALYVRALTTHRD